MFRRELFLCFDSHSLPVSFENHKNNFFKANEQRIFFKICDLLQTWYKTQTYDGMPVKYQSMANWAQVLLPCARGVR